MNGLEIEKYIKHRNEYRMYSFKQLFNIVTTVSDNSRINDRLEKAENEIADIYNKLDDQSKAREDLKDYLVDDLVNKTNMKMDNMRHQ